MTNRWIVCILVTVSASLASAHSSRPGTVRLEAIRRAQVWTKTDVSAMDIKAGPGGPGAFAPEATVTCD